MLPPLSLGRVIAPAYKQRGLLFENLTVAQQSFRLPHHLFVPIKYTNKTFIISLLFFDVHGVKDSILTTYLSAQPHYTRPTA
jgi:hypothetical protein